MSYYDPELAGWRYGRAARTLARRAFLAAAQQGAAPG